MEMNVLLEDDLAPFSSDKICEDFISGNHSHDLAPAGVRGLGTTFT